ncbi:hypothetical protein BY996DRAFT_8548366 [Phakopsora pachyrhizi]|nr:hypothetical protein BY996DRAFT_8548366 [Phakopsora pachyrhizi]
MMMNLLTSGSRSETLESEAHSSQHQSIISQFKQTHSEDYHQNQLLQLPPNYRAYFQALRDLQTALTGMARRRQSFHDQDGQRRMPNFRCQLMAPSAAGGLIILPIIKLLTPFKRLHVQSEVGRQAKLSNQLHDLLNISEKAAASTSKTSGGAIKERFLSSAGSSSSKKSKSEPVRLTRLFGLLMEDDEEEQQQEVVLVGEEPGEFLMMSDLVALQFEDAAGAAPAI